MVAVTCIQRYLQVGLFWRRHAHVEWCSGDQPNWINEPIAFRRLTFDEDARLDLMQPLAYFEKRKRRLRVFVTSA